MFCMFFYKLVSFFHITKRYGGEGRVTKPHYLEIGWGGGPNDEIFRYVINVRSTALDQACLSFRFDCPVRRGTSLLSERFGSQLHTEYGTLAHHIGRRRAYCTPTGVLLATPTLSGGTGLLATDISMPRFLIPIEIW